MPVYSSPDDGTDAMSRITQHESEAKETWKPMDRAGQDEVRRGPYSNLPYGAGELVRTCPQITKV